MDVWYHQGEDMNVESLCCILDLTYNPLKTRVDCPAPTAEPGIEYRRI